MSRKCDITGKSPNSANNVSHANNRTKKRQKPNVQKKKIYVEEKDRWIKVKLSNRALRTVDKKGLMNFLKDEGLTLDDIKA